MRIYILTDNTAGSKFLATHGFSCYIESEINILFDTGPDATFIENAKRLNISINPHVVVLSHGHWDHGNGLIHLPIEHKVPLICHPDCFIKRYSKYKNYYVGLSFEKNDIATKFELIETINPYFITENIVFLGQIPRKIEFESKRTDFVDGLGNDDFINDDSAIAIKHPDGLIIISGCSHSGICNIVDYASHILNENRILAIFGGFHLKTDGQVTQQTIRFLKQRSAKQVFPSHCTSLPALSAFYAEYRLLQVLTGNYYDF